MVQNGDDQDTLVMNLLVQMYGKFNALEDARATFDGMERRNIFSWTIMLGAYAECGLEREALKLFKSMEPSGVTPNKVTFITVVSVCASLADLVEGKVIHSCVEASPFILDTRVGNALVHMYDKCRSIEDACLVFGKMPEHNSITWNTLIAAHAHHGQNRDALQLFQQMQLENVIPDKVTFLNTLDAYADRTSLRECKRVHARIIGSGFNSDMVLGTALICMYSACGSLECASSMFNDMPRTSTILWNAVFAAYADQGKGKGAMQLYHQMLSESVLPNKVSFVTLFSVCADSEEGLFEGRRLHMHALLSSREWDLIIWNALINMYGKRGSLQEAICTFDEAPELDDASWNGLIAAFSQHGQEHEAIQFFQQMQMQCVIPNKVTFVSVLDACANKAEIAEGVRVHARIMESCLEKAMIKNRLEEVGNWCSMSLAKNMCGRVFGQAKKTDTLGMNMFDAGVSQELLHQINLVDDFDSSVTTETKEKHVCLEDQSFSSDLVIGNALVNMYSKCHDLQSAWIVFDTMPRRDVISWTAIIGAYAQEGLANVAFRLLFQMQEEGVKPNKVTFITVFDAFANRAALIEGELIHFYLVTLEYELDTEVGNAAMSMYGSCGCLEDAERVFNRMLNKNVVSWTTLISIYSHYGMGKQTHKLYMEMQQACIIPTLVTFVSVLSACSHAGLFEEGCRCFDSMTKFYGLSPTLEHYNCMVDLFARAGKLEEGIRMIQGMPMSPTAATWMTLLGACKIHQNVERALFVAEKIFELEPTKATPYVLLYNIFSSAGRCEDAEHIKAVMIDKGLEKTLISNPNLCGMFYSSDKSFPQISDDHNKLDSIPSLQGYGHCV
ncbi:hypothetical protein KP509_16G024400 [Ceratopteris richardii]|nr:hypothetical protein KP509_16G024400 [Ceratopteris richardii]